MTDDTDPLKWTEADYDKAARALVEQERRMARSGAQKGGVAFAAVYGEYKPWTDKEWAEAKRLGGATSAVGLARRDAYTALNAVPRVPEGFKLVRVQ